MVLLSPLPVTTPGPGVCSGSAVFSISARRCAGKRAAWALGDEPAAPNPESGVLLSRICSVAVLGLWVLYALGLDVNSGDFVGLQKDGPELLRHITLVVIAKPAHLIYGFLVACIPPGLVAVLKWSQTIAARRGRAKWTAIVQMTGYLLSLAASAVTIFSIGR